jgi:C4-dicarboxylate-specific signal transduction histidine kinase
MDDAREQVLREMGFGFFGAITASLSHQMNNVLAITNELSGLLDDFFYAADNGAPLDVEKLKGTSARIAAQVDRGREYVKRLNRFAHTVDDPQAAIEVNEAVETITTLCRRFGKLRQVELETALPEVSPRLKGSAFGFQHIVYRCVDIALNASIQGDVIKIGVEPDDRGVRLSISGGCNVEPSDELAARRDSLATLVEDMQGKADFEMRSGHPVRLVIALPHTICEQQGEAPS